MFAHQRRRQAASAPLRAASRTAQLNTASAAAGCESATTAKNVPAAKIFSYSLMEVVFGPWMRKFIELTVCRVCKFMNLQVS